MDEAYLVATKEREMIFARFFAHEAAPGILLILAAFAALVIANSPLAPVYLGLLGTEVSVLIEGAGIVKPLHLWINDGLMAAFFFVVALELKRELLEGQLSNRRDAMLPAMAALGGIVAPALIFIAITSGMPSLSNGWAIPAATDIAFALGVLALVGPSVPSSLKLFLLTLAILDDLGAIIIIALFYTADLQTSHLLMALVPLAGLALMNWIGVGRVAPYILVGAAMWVLVLKSGVHATLAGVITALFLPLTDRNGKSPLHMAEKALSPYVLFFIVPVFAFANAGVVLEGMTPADILAPLPLAIAAGLVIGKQTGVLAMTWLTVRLGFASLPKGTTWLQIYGIACLAGIGFTMSLFIGSLSYADPALMNEVRLGVLAGSTISAIIGFSVLRYALSRAAHKAAAKAV
jgi:NhaA family Na+:H+ antiporter